MAECDEETTFPDEFSNEFTLSHITETIPDVLLEDDEPKPLVYFNLLMHLVEMQWVVVPMFCPASMN